jgi:hypothetical protein
VNDREEGVGSVGEEAVKLFEALAGWAKEQGHEAGEGLADAAGAAAGAARRIDEHVATGAPECTWCPVCRCVHVVRTASPEVRAHLATAATSLLQAAAGLMATAVPDEHARPRSGVEHIGLDEEWPDDAGEASAAEEERP